MRYAVGAWQLNKRLCVKKSIQNKMDRWFESVGENRTFGSECPKVDRLRQESVVELEDGCKRAT